jgi:hypothetical protein
VSVLQKCNINIFPFEPNLTNGLYEIRKHNLHVRSFFGNPFVFWACNAANYEMSDLYGEIKAALGSKSLSNFMDIVSFIGFYGSTADESSSQREPT